MISARVPTIIAAARLTGPGADILGERLTP
jgi:hypothetical protein